MDTGYGVRYDLTQLYKYQPERTEEIPHNLGCISVDEIRNINYLGSSFKLTLN